MTKSNGLVRTVSPDPEEAFMESYHQLKEEGLSPDELVFRFKCQRCGLRCCMAPNLESVVFSPYSFTYIRQHIPKDTLQQLFQLNVLNWIAQPQSPPVLKIGGIVCPFLSLHWNREVKLIFQENLERIGEDAPPAFQLILVGILHVLTTIYYDSLRDTGLRDVEMQIPVHQLISVFLSVWDRVTFDQPDLFPDGDTVQGQYLRDFYEFLRHPPDPETLYQASCSIWPARPQICRIFPLGRLLSLEKSSTSSQLTQKVLLEKRICPPSAFQNQPLKTATQFLKDQQVGHLEYAVFQKVSKFLQQYPDFLNDLTPDETQKLYKTLCQHLYYVVDYTPDRRAFYHQLHTHLDTFIQDFDDLYLQCHQQRTDSL